MIHIVPIEKRHHLSIDEKLFLEHLSFAMAEALFYTLVYADSTTTISTTTISSTDCVVVTFSFFHSANPVTTVVHVE